MRLKIIEIPKKKVEVFGVQLQIYEKVPLIYCEDDPGHELERPRESRNAPFSLYWLRLTSLGLKKNK